ncbi:MAG TPA: glycosyltransferase family 4 protein [Verrucomicrobiae bacterium]|jgi:glycosyltransferase involved in cell wall biosynthesis
MTDANKSVLFINRVYPPGQGATGELLAELAEALAQQGWRVTVIAGRPSGVAARSEVRNGVTLAWVGGVPFTRRSHWRRALSYLSLYPAMWWRALRLPRHSATVLLTDPPMQFVFGPLLRLCKDGRVVHWAQDIYPEVAEELGVLKRRGALAGLLRAASNWALRRCDRVIALGSCMKQRFLNRAIAAAKIEVIPNWANTDEIKPIGSSQSRLRVECGLSEKFVVMYSGNFGLAHTFDALLDAAALLRERATHVAFLLVGDGPRLAWLKEQTASRKLDNVRLLPPRPRAQLADSLGAADVHLISMREGLSGLVVPSKIYAVFAAGRAAIFLGPQDSEAAQLILRHRCGSVLPAASGEALAECVLKWSANREELRIAGERAAHATMAGLGLSAAVCEFERVLAAQ